MMAGHRQHSAQVGTRVVEPGPAVPPGGIDAMTSSTAHDGEPAAHSGSARSSDAPPRRPIGTILFGIALVLAGALLLAERADLLDVDVWELARQAWPAVIVVVGVVWLVQRRWLEGGAATIIGLLLLAGTTGVGPEVGPELIGPIVLVVIGLAVLSAATRRPVSSAGLVLFSGVDRELDPADAEPQAVTAIFGGCDVRLLEGVPAEGSGLAALALFGGVEIRVPDGLPVRVRRQAIFGGVEVKVPETRRDEPAYEIDARAYFGGVEIRRR